MKSDLTALQQEVQRNRNQLQDLAYNLKNMTARIDDLEKKLQSFDSFVRLELGKIIDRLDKLET